MGHFAANDDYYNSWWQRSPRWFRQTVALLLAAGKLLAVFMALSPLLLALIDGEYEFEERTILSTSYGDYLPVQVGLKEGMFFIGRVDLDDPYTASYLLIPVKLKMPAYIETEFDQHALVASPLEYLAFFEILLLFVAGWVLILHAVVRRLRNM